MIPAHVLFVFCYHVFTILPEVKSGRDCLACLEPKADEHTPNSLAGHGPSDHSSHQPTPSQKGAWATLLSQCKPCSRPSIPKKSFSQGDSETDKFPRNAMSRPILPGSCNMTVTLVSSAMIDWRRAAGRDDSGATFDLTSSAPCTRSQDGNIPQEVFTATLPSVQATEVRLREVGGFKDITSDFRRSIPDLRCTSKSAKREAIAKCSYYLRHPSRVGNIR